MRSQCTISRTSRASVSTYAKRPMVPSFPGRCCTIEVSARQVPGRPRRLQTSAAGGGDACPREGAAHRAPARPRRLQGRSPGARGRARTEDRGERMSKLADAGARAPLCAGSRARGRPALAFADEAAGTSRGRAKPEARACTPVRGSPGAAAGPGVTCTHRALPAGAEWSPRCLRGRGRTPRVRLRAPPRCLRLPSLSELEGTGTFGKPAPEPRGRPCWERRLRGSRADPRTPGPLPACPRGPGGLSGWGPSGLGVGAASWPGVRGCAGDAPVPSCTGCDLGQRRERSWHSPSPSPSGRLVRLPKPGPARPLQPPDLGPSTRAAGRRRPGLASPASALPRNFFVP
ncbi:collagen alpha-3(IV) chain [Pongo abelii]|uniref:collagen alpha-3(IV) chain n=1 Tax=Pongo abelii TaxID=9601 RepID=UPI003007D11A